MNDTGVGLESRVLDARRCSQDTRGRKEISITYRSWGLRVQSRCEKKKKGMRNTSPKEKSKGKQLKRKVGTSKVRNASLHNIPKVRSRKEGGFGRV